MQEVGVFEWVTKHPRGTLSLRTPWDFLPPMLLGHLEWLNGTLPPRTSYVTRDECLEP